MMRRMRMRLDFQELVQTAVYVVLFGALFLVYGLTLKQSLALGIILSQFYLILYKIHFRLRR